MKFLITVITCFLLVAVSAQTPYNPDADDDSLITHTDFLEILTFYGQPFFPELNFTDSILIYDMQPEIYAHWELYPGGSGGYPVITIPATADKVVMLSTGDDNCTQGPYCNRVNLLIEDSYLYDEITIVWVSTNHYPYNLWPDQYNWQGAHFTLINTENGWLKPI